MSKKQKLELTWNGKGDEHALEPRILIEDYEKSYGDPESQNILIHGDNLLALKALEHDYAGKVKCVYIDPPYNTGSAFEHYDDGLENSLWLKLMKTRLEILRNLLSESGFIFINIDDNQVSYLSVLCDEIFGRNNKFDKIAVKTSSSQGGFGSVNPGLVSNTEYILIYCKDRSSAKFNEEYLFTKNSYDHNYKYYILNEDAPHEEWVVVPLDYIVYEKLGLAKPYDKGTWRKLKDKYGHIWKKIRDDTREEVAFANPDRVFRTYNPNKPAAYLREALISSKKAGERITNARTDADAPLLCYKGEVLLKYSKQFRLIDNELLPSKMLTTFWDDVPWEGIANEGLVKFSNGKKPEKLLKRIIEITSQPGDLILDSFLGSGTTAAVAHKLRRHWIGIELGEHAYTHCVPRLRRIVDGDDKTGVTSMVNWESGGGFKFYELGTSLLAQDDHGNWVISRDYDGNMLAHAMAKQEGFTYLPSQVDFWKQGFSSENDYIYTTTQHITVELLDTIHNAMQDDESLIIACKAFDSACKDRFDNITIKKIPHILLGRCEFGRDDYSLNIAENTEIDTEEVEDEL